MATGRSPCFYIEELNKYQQKNCVEVRYCELAKTGLPHIKSSSCYKKRYIHIKLKLGE